MSGDVRWRIRLLQTPQELSLIDKTRNQLQQRLQILCDLAYTTGLPSTDIFTLRMLCSTTRTSEAALQSTGGKRCVRTLASFCVAPVANAVIHAVDCTANSQVFCR